MLIDTHCHLYLPEFKDDLIETLNRAEDAGVQKFCLPAIDRSESASLLDLEQQYPGKFFAMAGLHPCSVKENYKEELDYVKECIDKRSFVAIGEIGLDFYWDTTFSTNQYEAFEMQMNWALEKNLPIVIHTRKAMKETIDSVKPFAAKGLKGIFHCFGGTFEEAEQIIGMNFLLGIGGVVTYKNAGLAEVVAQIDMKNIVLETDSPYLAPVPYRGKRNESAYLRLIAEKIALVKGIDFEEVAAITSGNAEKIFNI